MKLGIDTEAKTMGIISAFYWDTADIGDFALPKDGTQYSGEQAAEALLKENTPDNVIVDFTFGWDIYFTVRDNPDVMEKLTRDMEKLCKLDILLNFNEHNETELEILH